MQRWEYKIVGVTTSDAEAELNKLGHEGWELVAVIEAYYFYLKRPLSQ